MLFSGERCYNADNNGENRCGLLMSKSSNIQPPHEVAEIETLNVSRSPLFSTYVLSNLQTIKTQIFSNEPNEKSSSTKETISVRNNEENIESQSPEMIISESVAQQEASDVEISSESTSTSELDPFHTDYDSNDPDFDPCDENKENAGNKNISEKIKGNLAEKKKLKKSKKILMNGEGIK